MKSAKVTCIVISLCQLALASSASTRGETATTPILKVVEMLNGMLVKGKEEKHAEAVQYAAYKQFCDDTTTEKQRAIQEAQDEIEMLNADIEGAQTEASALAKKIQELDADTMTYEADVKASTTVREKEKAEYTKVHQDYTESVDAIQKAVAYLQSQNFNRAQATMLQKQVLSLKTPAETRRAIESFLAKSSDPLDVSPPEAKGYESRSGGVIDMLEKLRDKFVDERTELEKEEMNLRHAYTLLMQDLEKSIDTAKDLKTSKVQQKAKEMQTAATKKGDLQDEITTEAETTKYLKETAGTCTQKSADFTERQKLRADELSALQQAISILSGDQVSGSNTQLYSSAFVQQRGGVAFLQVRSNNANPDRVNAAIAYLTQQADKTNSRVLSALAVRAHDDPFAKVKKMVQDLIIRLQEQANEETEHKGFCDKELGENEQVRASRTQSVESLSAEIDELQSVGLKLGSEITQATVDLAATEQQVATETKLRQEEKTANEATVKDAQDAQTAVGQALTVLKEFYDRAAESTALVQNGKKLGKAKTGQDPPPVFDTAYTGLGGESGGVVAMLEVIQSDFARLESTTAATEATAAQDFDKAMSEAAVSKATIKADIQHKTHQRQTGEETVLNRENDLSSAQKELEAANNYYDKLKPSCVSSGSSFEERDTRRKEEIESLQEALRILNGEDIA